MCTVLPATASDDISNRLCYSYKARHISDTYFNGIYLRKNTHNFGMEMEYLFHILCSKDGKLLQRVGIFRVQPGILEVLLVKNTRDLGKF
jgi:hypothetical protein